MRSVAAANAYRRSTSARGIREQEADVFLRMNAVLRGAQRQDILGRAKALADNDRLWTTLLDLLRDPANPLAPPLRASIISVGLAVQREVKRAEPDFGFLIGVNEQIAAGLSGV